MKRYLPSVLKNQLGWVFDLLVYYCLPRKTIVLIMSSARSGSTLLKALLGEAPDISHLPEVDYTRYGKYGVSPYYVYRRAYFLSEKRIVVLKYPGVTIKLLPPLDRFKIIVLTRDAYGVVQSLRERRKDTEQKHLTKADWVRHWCRIYQMILDSVRSMNADFCLVRYEDILKDPRAATKKLFAFLGSRQTEGVERYQQPKGFRWEWGKDDASEKLKGLKIVQEHSREKAQDGELLDIIENSPDARALREEFGYLNNGGQEHVGSKSKLV